MNTLMVSLALVLTFLINVPFGYWRGYASNTKNKKEWILAIHLPVPLVFLLRFLSGSGLKLIPVFVLFFFTGQMLGGKLFLLYNRKLKNSSRCIYVDTRTYLKLGKK